LAKLSIFATHNLQLSTMPYSETDIQHALSEIQAGRSIRNVAKDLKIPRSTLGSRLDGSQSRKLAFEPHQILTRAQESNVTQWFLSQVALGVPPTHNQLQEFVSRILTAQGKDPLVGKGWVKRFIARNPVLKTQRENEAPKEQLEAVRPTKRRKVVPDPTPKLLSIEEIQRAQIQAGRSAAVVSEESGSESGESEASCIVVRSKRR
jgi:hypothetical protein